MKSTPPSVIRAVTFDLWGTLYHDGPAADQRLRLRIDYARDFFIGQGRQVSEAQLGYALEIMLRRLDRLREVNHASMNAEEIGRELAMIVGARLGREQAVRLGDLISWAGRERPPVAIEGAREVLSALHGAVRLGLISDTGLTLGKDLYAVLEADGVAQLLDHLTFSDQTQTTKPMARQFNYTLLGLGCRPEEAVHVGDSEATDIAGAKAAGLRAIRILTPSADPTTAADAAVKNISEVPEVLRKWGLDV